MVGRMRFPAAACLMILVGVGSAQANGLRSRTYYRASVVYSPIEVRPIYVMWACTPSPFTAVPLAPAKPAPSAAPVPAPPSDTGQSKEPPLESRSDKGPTILESRSSSTTKSQPATEKCKVGFWNQTGRDITLTIDGKPRLLPRDRAITLELNRLFVWRIDQNEPTSERVAADESYHELIIRK